MNDVCVSFSRKIFHLTSYLLLLRCDCDANASPPLNQVSHHPQSYDNTIWHSAFPHKWSWRWLGPVCLQACLWQDEDVVSRRAAGQHGWRWCVDFDARRHSGLQEDRHSDAGVQSEGMHESEPSFWWARALSYDVWVCPSKDPVLSSPRVYSPLLRSIRRRSNIRIYVHICTCIEGEAYGTTFTTYALIFLQVTM